MRTFITPLPDSFGNYWLGVAPIGPAVFKSCVHRGKLFASRGVAKDGVLFDNAGIRYFDSLQQAMEALADIS